MKSRPGNLDNRPISPVARDKHQNPEGQKSKQQRKSNVTRKKEKKIPSSSNLYHPSEKANNQDNGSTRQVSEFVYDRRLDV